MASSFLRRLRWIRFRYESMAKIHLFFQLILPIFQLVACNYIGNSNRDSTLSPKYRNLSLSRLKNGLHVCLWHYKQICQNCVTRNMKSLILDMHYSVYCDSTSKLLSIHYLLGSWITWHGLSTWHLSDSAHEWLDTHCNSTSIYLHIILSMHY